MEQKTNFEKLDELLDAIKESNENDNISFIIVASKIEDDGVKVIGGIQGTSTNLIATLASAFDNYKDLLPLVKKSVAIHSLTNLMENLEGKKNNG